MSQAIFPDAERYTGAALVEEELISSVTWFIRLRWLAGGGVLAATWLTATILHLPLPTMPLYTIGLAILAYNAVFWIALKRLESVKPRRVHQFDLLTQFQIGLDWLAMAALIHFSGGIESPAIFYFFFHLIIASILLSPRATYLYAVMATLLVGAIAGLEYGGRLPHVYVIGSEAAALYRNPFFVIGVWFFFGSATLGATYLASTLNSRLRQREAQVVELSQRLQRAYGRLQTLYASAAAVNSTLELQQVLDRLVQRTVEALGVRACSIRLLDETGTRLHVAANYGLSEAYVKKGDLLLKYNPLAREVLGGKVVTIGDVTADKRLQYPAEAVAEGIGSMLTAPLQGKQGPLGLIRAYSVEKNRFTEEDAAFLSAIASQGSIAIENAMAFQALGDLDEMKSKFVLTATHELRSPVSVVRSLLRTMLGGYAGAQSEEQRDLATRALRRADFLQTLIDDLLDLAATKSELHEREERVKVRLDEATERVVQRFQVPAQEKQIQLGWRFEGQPRPITISATNEGVDRILNNLVANAIKYTPPGGRVGVLLRSDGDMAQVEVTDTGIGIPEEALPHIFEEFYRAPNAKAHEKEGTGLGLAITKDLVTRYGGQIAVWSTAGQGTVFVVTFPVAA